MLLDDFYDNGTGDEIYRKWLNETETTQRKLGRKATFDCVNQKQRQRKLAKDYSS